VKLAERSGYDPVGLGYSKPAAGLMERPPPPARPVRTRPLIVWLAFVGPRATIRRRHRAHTWRSELVASGEFSQWVMAC
jgi:hypothetical protein